MEILQNLQKIDIESLGTFQLKVWNILSSLFKNLMFDRLSNESSIEQGKSDIDIFLRLKENDFILYMSITEQVFHINSKYFNIYVYPEKTIDKIESLSRCILSGKYSIIMQYTLKGKPIGMKLILDNEELKEFNETQLFSFFSVLSILFCKKDIHRNKKKIEERVEGIRLIST